MTSITYRTLGNYTAIVLGFRACPGLPTLSQTPLLMAEPKRAEVHEWPGCR